MALIPCRKILGTKSLGQRGSEPHYGIKTSVMMYWGSCGSDQAMCLKELLVADGLGVANGE